jgi:uncharacterized protein (TIGR03083 family)
MASLGAAYSDMKQRMLRSIGDVHGAAWGVPVPATPEWNVRDVVAHVTGIAVDAAAGVLPADLDLMEQFRDESVVRDRDAFADGQVQRRHGQTPAVVVAEWDGAEPMVVDRLEREAGDPAALPFGFDVVLVTDLCVHADDVAGALGIAPHRDATASRIALAGYCFSTDYRLRALGLPALVLRYDGRERTVGDGAPAATLTADRWELLRVLAGRRSRSQIAALDWTGDPSPYLPVLPTYGERAGDLIEVR